MSDLIKALLPLDVVHDVSEGDGIDKYATQQEMAAPSARSCSRFGITYKK